MATNAEYVVFKINGEHYGLDINNVENIEKPMDITRVPYTEDYVKGVVNLRGNIIPVIDLRRRFHLEERDMDDDSRIIIVNSGELKVGMVVDSSSEVIKLNSDDIDPAPALSGSKNVNFIKEIGKNDGRIIMLIDFHKVLGIDTLDAE